MSGEGNEWSRRDLDSPEDEADHGDDSGGARVGQTSSKPRRGLGEVLEEPLVENGRITAGE